MFKSTKASYAGFQDVFGREARLREFITAKVSEVFQLWGYDKIELSIIESLDSFSKRVVGGSPWPEWNQKCSFKVDINDYAYSYNNKPVSHHALLVPEGTISVSRWLANQIDDGHDLQDGFPLKIYYVVNCFRNEPKASLSTTKSRSFTQLGVEVIGTSNRCADLETIALLVNGLESIGTSKDRINARIGDIRIFNHLCNKSNIPYQGAIVLKEVFDAIAESRASNDTKRLNSELTRANKILSANVTDSKTRDQWDFCLAGHRRLISHKEAIFLDCIEAVNDLNFIAGELNELDIRGVIDLAVVRSHEYYTGVVFEVDVAIGDQIIVEIAGGGRYNKLISRLSKKSIMVPATGYAFGLERICRLTEDSQNFTGSKIHFWSDESSADIILYGQKSTHHLINFAQQLRKSHKRVAIYVGDNFTDQRVASYAAAKGAQLICIGGQQ